MPNERCIDLLRTSISLSYLGGALDAPDFHQLELFLRGIEIILD